MEGMFDCIIAGAGIIGLSVARELQKRGIENVIVIDRREAGRESSWAAAGMLSPDINAVEADEFHRFCRESLAIFPQLAEELLDETGIDIELDRRGTLAIALNEADAEELSQRYERQVAAGIDVKRLEAVEVLKAEPNISASVRFGLFYPNDWQVDNRKLLAALRASVEMQGVRMIENIEIERLVIENGRVTGCRSADREFRGETTVLATGAWTSLIKFGEREAPFRVMPIRGQMIAFESGQPLIKRVVYSPRGYLVPRRDGRLLVGATVEDCGFSKQVTDHGIDSLRSAAVAILPALGDFRIADAWAGLRPCAPDEMPVIGSVAGFDGLIVATGHYRNGILLAPKTAEIVANVILDEKEPEYSTLTSPQRFAPRVFTNPYIQ